MSGKSAIETLREYIPEEFPISVQGLTKQQVEVLLKIYEEATKNQ